MKIMSIIFCIISAVLSTIPKMAKENLFNNQELL